MEHFEKSYYFREPDVPRGFSLASAGEEACEANHSYGGLRDTFLVHFISRGEGIFTQERRTYHLHEGQLFFIFPGKSNFYQADSQNPWHYCWATFYGSDCASLLRQTGITVDNPIVNVKDCAELQDNFTSLFSLCEEGANRHDELRFISLLLAIISSGEISGGLPVKDRDMLLGKSRNDIHCDRVRRFVQMNYQNPIGVKDIARFTALDRTYLSALWKEETGVTLRDYLAEYRVRKACFYLKSTEMSIKEISFSVGYREYPVFERFFKRRTGMTPRQWRNS